jgi:hypothetical protein
LTGIKDPTDSVLETADSPRKDRRMESFTFPILGAAVLALLPCSVDAKPRTPEAVKIGSRIDVIVGEEFFTSYRFAEDEKYPFFYPVNGPSGAGVTSMRNGRFPHHSSQFFGCDRINGGNDWQQALEKGRIASEGPEIVRAKGEEIVITDRCVWRRPGGRPLRDERRIVLRAPSPRHYEIDFSITLEALVDVEILKTNHSLFGARMDPDLTPVFGGEMVNAEGGERGEGDLRQTVALARLSWPPRRHDRGAGDFSAPVQSGLLVALVHPEADPENRASG